MSLTVVDSLTESERQALLASGVVVIVSANPSAIKQEGGKDIVLTRRIAG